MKRYTGSMDEPGRSVVARRPADRHGRRQNKERRPPRIHRIRRGRQMQYREIYQVLEDRRKADPHFVYDDYSRCRPKSQRHGRILGPLWNVAIARACLKIGDVPSGEGFWAAGKQFFRGNPDGFQGKIAPSRGQKTRRLGMLIFFKQALGSTQTISTFITCPLVR